MKRSAFIISVVFLFTGFSAVAQQLEVMKDLIAKAQNAIDKQPFVRSDLEYNFYPTYTHKSASETFKGQFIKNGDTNYTKINETIFLTNIKTNTSLKLNKLEKIILLGENNIEQALTNLNLFESFMNLFKTHQVIDKGTYWQCVLATDVITKLPYGKVVIDIDKKDYNIRKQELFLLGQFPYKDTDGNTLMGNPRIEILLTNHSNLVSESEKTISQFSSYITYNKTTVQPVDSYKDFKIIQN